MLPLSLGISYSHTPDFQIQEMCPILIAAEKNDVDMFKLCLRKSTLELNLNISNEDGKTALILAIERNNVDILDVLLHEDFVWNIDFKHCDVS